MHGVGEATAAITIVNALPTGIGAAAGIELRSRAEVTLRRAPAARAPAVVFRPRSAATPLVRAALGRAVERFAPSGVVPAELGLRSEIPPATGLKSSSAVASSIALAVARAAGRPVEPADVAGVSALAGRTAGVSATGAFDDALAGLVGGAVVTDNRQDQLLRTFRLDPALAVALWIPPGTHPPSPDARDRFPSDSIRTRAPAESARAGRIWEAMELNSEIVEGAMGYPYAELRRRLREAGAVGVGASGLGPTLAAVGPKPRIAGFLELLGGLPGRRLAVEFSTHAVPRGTG